MSLNNIQVEKNVDLRVSKKKTSRSFFVRVILFPVHPFYLLAVTLTGTMVLMNLSVALLDEVDSLDAKLAVWEKQNTLLYQRAALVKAFRSPFKTIQVDAQSAYLVELDTGKVLYTRNEDLILPLASITKVMTAYTVNHFTPDMHEIVIRGEDLQVEGGYGLGYGELWNAPDLRDFTLVTSSNVGARALGRTSASSYLKEHTIKASSSSAYFVTMMNRLAKEKGLDTLRFANPSGLDVTTEVSGSYGTVKDVAGLLKVVLAEAPEIVRATQNKEITVSSKSGIMHTAVNTNQYVEEIDGLVASKTGFTNLSGGNLAVVFEVAPGKYIAAVVLGSNKEGRFSDIQTLVSATEQAFSSQVQKTH